MTKQEEQLWNDMVVWTGRLILNNEKLLNAIAKAAKVSPEEKVLPEEVDSVWRGWVVNSVRADVERYRPRPGRELPSI